MLQGKYEYKGTISKNVNVDYFPFEVINKDRMAIEIVKNIEAICVDENCRGNGIGTLLLEYTKNICKTLPKKNNLCYNIKS